MGGLLVSEYIFVWNLNARMSQVAWFYRKHSHGADHKTIELEHGHLVKVEFAYKRTLLHETYANES